VSKGSSGQKAGAPAGSVQTGAPYAQGQQMYSQPYMAAGMSSAGGTPSPAPQGQYPGPYTNQAFNPQQGYNPLAMLAGMQNYYTPIPQQMPQSPYQAGYTYGGNAPPANPARGTTLPLAPIQPSQLPYSSALTTAIGSGSGAGPAAAKPTTGTALPGKGATPDPGAGT
jgi:hypothetical protein